MSNEHNNAPDVPEGFELVAVKGFSELMYWLERCENKGHLENCPDLVEPWAAFEYRNVATPAPAPAPAQEVGLTDEEICECFGIDGADDWVFKGARAIIEALRAKGGK